MFTTTNVAGTTASAGGGGPIAAAVPPTFQIISTPVTGPSSSSVSSTTWRLTPTASSIKQPSVVSIINGNMNVSSATTVPINSTGVTMPTNGNILYIATTNSQQHNPVTSGNLIFQSPQTVRLVSSSLSTPTLTLLNNRNTTVINNSRQIITPSSKHFR